MSPSSPPTPSPQSPTPSPQSSLLKQVLIRLVGITLTICIATPLVLWIVTAALDRNRMNSADRSRDGEARRLDGPLSSETFAPVQVVPRMPVVQGFQVVDVDIAQGQVGDEELVLAVEVDGQARAWPLNIMTGPEREVFNDELAGRSIAATW